MNKKKIISILTLVAMLSTTTFLNAYADESTTNSITEPSQFEQTTQKKLTDSEKTELTNFLTENGVDSQTIENLITKLEVGQIWDCLKEEYTNIEPVLITNPDGSTTSKYIYPDGSIKLKGTELPSAENTTNGINTRNISGGTWYSGTGYRYVIGAKVYEYTGIANVTFYADFEILSTGYDRINSVYDEEVTTIGGDYSDLVLTNSKPQEDLNGVAYAKVSFKFTAYSGAGAQTCWMKLNVGKNTYYSSTN